MAPLFRQVLVLYLVLVFFTSILLVCVYTEPTQPLSNEFQGTRRMLELQDEDQPIKKKKTTTLSTKNQTKLIKAPTALSKNKTKLIKPTDDSTKETTTTIKIKTQLKKLNSTSKTSNSTKPSSKTSNSTKPSSKTSNSNKLSSNLTEKSSDLIKPSSPKNKTIKPITTKQSKTQLDKNLTELKSKNPDKNKVAEKKPKSPKTEKPTQQSWIEREDHENDDSVTDFTELPFKFQETLLPDLEKISTTSKVYLNKANKQITQGFKPFVGTKYAPTIASIVCFAFILIPLVLVSLIFNRIKAYFSLQKLLIFIQAYLSIYFSILCLSSLVTGLEPLGFFYATSQTTYVCLQVLQTLGYVLYLLLLLMYLILVFSADSGPGSKMVGLGQTFVGFAVGVHYYVTVFHNVVLRQPPKTNWRVHGIYATCFLVICLLATADRRKKAYLVDDGEEGKKS